MKKQPLVSIVIPTFNRKSLAERLIRSVFKSSYKNLEIIVVDDASDDGTYEFLKNHFSNNIIKIIRNKKNRFAAGSRNVGIRQAKGKYIFFIDDDNILDKRTISLLTDYLEKNSHVGELGPVNYSLLDKKKILWAGTKRNMFTSKTSQLRNIDGLKKIKAWDTDDVLNSYMIRADILKKNKIFFREFYGIMYEESDIAYRIKRLGYDIKVLSEAIIYHDVELLDSNNKLRDYIFHFMEDNRRFFVFARNRLIFHRFYSKFYQYLIIAFFWSWIFAIYYIYKIMFYSSKDKVSFKHKCYLCIRYLYGILIGIRLTLRTNYFSSLV